MQDLKTRFMALSRPRILLRAARKGQSNYIRNKHLRRISDQGRTPSVAAGLARLLDLEHEVNHHRLQRNPAYSHARHVELLIAIMSEAQLYLATQNAKMGSSSVKEPPISVRSECLEMTFT